MTTRTTASRRPAAGRKGQRQRRRSRGWIWWVAGAAAVLAVLFAVFRSANHGGSAEGGPSGYQVGTPGAGQPAPTFTLAASTGQPVSLRSLRGRTVLVYFQEGLTCEPCWTQMKDLEAAAGKVRAAGVDQIVSITTDPASLLAQKAHDEGLATPVLSDPDLAVSRAYHANSYGMMGDSRDGHTFVLIGPDGTIRWRADYGGAPNYTMYVPPAQLLADLTAGRRS